MLDSLSFITIHYLYLSVLSKGVPKQVNAKLYIYSLVYYYFSDYKCDSFVTHSVILLVCHLLSGTALFSNLLFKISL